MLCIKFKFNNNKILESLVVNQGPLKIRFDSLIEMSVNLVSHFDKAVGVFTTFEIRRL